MKKTALHFKIATWSCRYPTAFYTVNSLLLCLLIISAVFLWTYAPSSKIETNIFPVEANQVSRLDFSDWKPVRDMNLPDGIKCRLYENNDTSITNCYIFREGEWTFYQSF